MVRIRKGGVGGGGWGACGAGRGRGRKGGGLRHPPPPVSFLAKPLPAPPSPPPHPTVTTIFPNGRVFISHIYILYASLLNTVLLSTHTHTHTHTHRTGSPIFHLQHVESSALGSQLNHHVLILNTAHHRRYQHRLRLRVGHSGRTCLSKPFHRPYGSTSRVVRPTVEYRRQLW